MRARWSAVVIALVVTAGSAYTFGVVGPPTVVAAENHLAGIDDGETLVRTEVTVHNPNPLGFDVDDVTIAYRVEMGNVTMATGRQEGLSITTGEQTLTYLTAMNNERIPEWWARHVRNGERSSLAVTVDVRSRAVGPSVSATPVEEPIETDLLASFNSTETREIHTDLLLVDDPVLYVNETAGWWGAVTESESPIATRLTVYNPKPVPYAVTSIGYVVTMNGVPMGEGRTDRTHVIEPRSTTTVETTTVIENDRLDDWWVTHLENDERTDLRIHYYAVVELPTGDEVRIPLEEIAHTETFETDIFRNTGTSE